MIDFIAGVESSAMFGLNWPTWIAGGGTILLGLAVGYAAVLFFAPENLSPQLRRLQPRTLRGRMSAGITLAAAVPALCMALVLIERAAGERVTRTTDLLESQAERFNENIEVYLRDITAELVAIANRAPDGAASDANTAESWLIEQHRNLGDTFSDLILVDRTAAIVATTRIVDSRAVIAAASEESLANRPFFYFPMTSPAPYVSNAIEDSSINARARALISVPLRAGTERSRGVLFGTISAQHLESIESRMMMDKGMGILITDRNGDKIFSSGTINLSRIALPTEEIEVFGFSHQTANSDRAEHFVAAGFSLGSGWRTYVYQPLFELEVALIWDYLVIVLGLMIAIIISLGLSRKLASEYARPLLVLDHAISEFDLNMSPRPTMLSSATPNEIRSIFTSLEQMNHRLRAAYGKLRNSVHQGEKLRGELIYVIANREKEILQRTEELKEANETLERLSREDSLTGLANRRWFAEFLARTWRRAIREKQPVSVLIIDIDNFKAYNDTYGHQKGDMCLKLVAEAIRRSVGRATDLVSRYGGEEFIVVLGDTPLDGALQIAEEIRATIEKLDIPHEGAEFHPMVTVSIGATSTLPSADMQPETFLVAADRAMYRAKNDGKNQVAYSTSTRTGIYQALCLPDNDEKRLS